MFCSRIVLQCDIMAASLAQLIEEGWGDYTMQQEEGEKIPCEKAALGEDRGIIIMSPSWTQLLFQILLLLVCCRHINTKTSGATPSPLAPVPTVARSVVLKGESQNETIEVLNPIKLELECTWTGDQDKLPNITVYWMKDENEIENSRLTVQLENEPYNLKREFSIEKEENLGTYSCVFENVSKINFILAAPQIGDVREKPIVSYVGDYVVMTCKMEESKPKPSSWNWYKKNGTDEEQIFPAEEPRYKIKNEDEKTKLVVHNLTEADSGLYYCGAVYAIATTKSPVKLKVITYWEPLKPFLAILAEVIVLVAIILLCEKSQSKKDGATGNETNADQTYTLTEGENKDQEGNSSVRQRKV
uniref:embigin n=1 Tax=Monopterus albus TaxID=43700 RepID=UPI0009B3410E|nr:embigin [Monopterus albus]